MMTRKPPFERIKRQTLYSLSEAKHPQKNEFIPNPQINPSLTLSPISPSLSQLDDVTFIRLSLYLSLVHFPEAVAHAHCVIHGAEAAAGDEASPPLLSVCGREKEEGGGKEEGRKRG